MNLTEAARAIGISARTLRLAVEHGELQAEHPLPDGPWIFHRDALNANAVAELIARARGRRRGSALLAEEQGTLDLSMT
jgi:hypothetical protein